MAGRGGKGGKDGKVTSSRPASASGRAATTLPPLLSFPPFPPFPPPSHLTYSLSPSLPPSRPNPLSRYPPKPLAASNRLVQLIQTVPACSCGATSSARLIFAVQRRKAR